MIRIDSKQIRRFFENTESVHLTSCVEGCNPGPNLGARGTFAEWQSVTGLVAASWEPYVHPAVQAPAKAYKAPIGGNLGVVKLVDLGDPGIELTLNWIDVPNQFEVIYTTDVNFPTKYTTLVIGPSKDDKSTSRGATVVAIHIGDPVSPCQCNLVGYEHGQTITVGEAIDLGFEYAKIQMKQ